MHHHHTGEGKFVHKDRGPREPRHSEFWHGKRKKFAIANLVTVGLLQVLFLANLSNFYGSAFENGGRVHNFKVLLVDYDASIVGEALRATYNRLRGDAFPTLVPVDAAEYPTEQSLINEVCHNRHIYAVIYTHAGASDRLSAAIAGGVAAEQYNASDAISYVWNGVRYNTFAASVVSANLQKLITSSGVAFAGLNGTYAYNSVNTSSPQAVTTLAQPFIPSDIDIMPTYQGSRAFYNTVTIVMTIISQFFYVLGMNGIAGSFGMFTRLSISRNLGIRWSSGLLYSTALAATLTGVIWAFRESWPVTASQGVETWLLFTFICNIHFLVLDTAAGFVPMRFVSYFVLTWVLINVTSTVVPLELAPGFYHWQYALPSFETYQLLVTIWSRGCVSQTFRALPILFTWWIVGLAGSWLSMIQKCNAATHIEQASEETAPLVQDSATSDSDNVDDGAGVESATRSSTSDQEKPATNDFTSSTTIPPIQPTQSNANNNTTTTSMRPPMSKQPTRTRVTNFFTNTRNPADALWMSAPVPFQDTILGLSSVRSAPAAAGGSPLSTSRDTTVTGAGSARPGLAGKRMGSRPEQDA